MHNKETAAADQFGALLAEIAEVREGHDALLSMYEELRELYPQNCRCAALSERAQMEVLAADPFVREYPREDYVPGE